MPMRGPKLLRSPRFARGCGITDGSTGKLPLRPKLVLDLCEQVRDVLVEQPYGRRSEGQG